MGPYKIKKILGLVSYELKIPKGLNIYLVFYKLLLEKAPLKAKLGLVLIDLETQEPLYNVDKIIIYNLKTRKYLIR